MSPRSQITYTLSLSLDTHTVAPKFWPVPGPFKNDKFYKLEFAVAEKRVDKMSKLSKLSSWRIAKLFALSKCQILQTVRKRHAFHILVEIISRSQSVRRGHTYPTLVEFITKSQTHKTLWKTKVACSNGVVKCVAPSKDQGKLCFRGFELH